MYISVVFIEYISAIFATLLGIALIVLLISKKRDDNSKVYRAIIEFSMAVFLICLLYFYFYFRDSVMKDYSVAAPLRALDYLISGIIVFCWIRVIDALSAKSSRKKLCFGAVLAIAISGSGIITALFFMDEYYNMRSRAFGMAFSVTEAVLIITASIFIVKCTFDFVRSAASMLQKQYVITVSATWIVWNIQQVFVDSSLYLGVYISAWSRQDFDLTGPATFVIALITFIYVFKEDFSPLFYREEGGSIDIQEKAAMRYGLTTRECDVMKLVYQGCNNPEIAETLCISRNTVKKHIQNIFDKTNVNSRMELVHLINEER